MWGSNVLGSTASRAEQALRQARRRRSGSRRRRSSVAARRYPARESFGSHGEEILWSGFWNSLVWNLHIAGERSIDWDRREVLRR